MAGNGMWQDGHSCNNDCVLVLVEEVRSKSKMKGPTEWLRSLGWALRSNMRTEDLVQYSARVDRPRVDVRMT